MCAITRSFIFFTNLAFPWSLFYVQSGKTLKNWKPKSHVVALTRQVFPVVHIRRLGQISCVFPVNKTKTDPEVDQAGPAWKTCSCLFLVSLTQIPVCLRQNAANGHGSSWGWSWSIHKKTCSGVFLESLCEYNIIVSFCIWFQHQTSHGYWGCMTHNRSDFTYELRIHIC